MNANRRALGVLDSGSENQRSVLIATFGDLRFPGLWLTHSGALSGLLGVPLTVASLNGCSAQPDYRVIRTLAGLGPTDLIAGKGGNLYGALEAGGGKGEGLVFKLKPDGTDFEVLHHFSGCLSGGADGSQP